MKTIPFLIGLMSLFLFPLPAGPTDCADNFPAGRFGLSQEDPAFNSGKLVRDGFIPIFLRKGSVPPRTGKRVYRLQVCEYVQYLPAGL